MQKVNNQELVFGELVKLRKKNHNQPMEHDIRFLLQKFEGTYGVTKDNLYYRWKKYKQGHNDDDGDDFLASPVGMVSPSTDEGNSPTSDEGNSPAMDETIFNQVTDVRAITETPTASNRTLERIQVKKIDVELVKAVCTIASKRFQDCCDEAKSKNEFVPPNTLKNIIESLEMEHKLPPGTLKPETIRSRVKRKNISGVNKNLASPIEDLEPMIAQYIVYYAQMGDPLTRDEVIEVANELIEAEPLVKMRLQNYKKMRKIPGINSNGTVTVGLRWFNAFMKRYAHIVASFSAKNADDKRKSFCTREKIYEMYNNIYPLLVDSGVAKELDEEVMLDIDGNVVHDKSQMYGHPTRYLITDPDNILFFDETGCNTNQKKDAHIGQQKFVMGTGGGGQGRAACTTDVPFTCIPFVSASGATVMCAIILKSKKSANELKTSWLYGIDHHKIINCDSDDPNDFMLSNTGDGKAIAGGPTCIFKGKEVPCFIGSSPNASITSTLLVQMLRAMDDLKLFDRENGKRPVLICDGHQSRTSLEFLDYCYDEQHRWMPCLGVAYGTHVWQPADSPQMNGNFKAELAKEKHEYLKDMPVGEKVFVVSDIIPLVRRVWARTFGRSEYCKRAISQRGFNPLNYILLDDPRLQHEVSSPELEPIQLYPTIEIESSDDEEILTFSFKKKSKDRFVEIVKYEAKQVKKYEKYWEEDKKKRDGKLLAKRLADCTAFCTAELVNNNEGIGSGKLTAAGIFHLDEDYHHILRERHHRKQMAQNEVSERKKKAAEAKQTAYKEAAAVYMKEPQNMKVKHVKALVSYYQQDGDSPIKSKKDPLLEQWERRKSRFDAQRSVFHTTEGEPEIPVDVDNTNDVDANDNDSEEES
jgi:hypothetical protein